VIQILGTSISVAPMVCQAPGSSTTTLSCFPMKTNRSGSSICVFETLKVTSWASLPSFVTRYLSAVNQRVLHELASNIWEIFFWDFAAFFRTLFASSLALLDFQVAQIEKPSDTSETNNALAAIQPMYPMGLILSLTRRVKMMFIHVVGSVAEDGTVIPADGVAKAQVKSS